MNKFFIFLSLYIVVFILYGFVLKDPRLIHRPENLINGTENTLNKNDNDQSDNISLLKNKLLNNISIKKMVDINTTTPSTIIQTYHTKDKIPIDIYDNISKYAPEYTHLIFDDDECKSFISSYFTPIVLQTFIDIKGGAHKTDLFRYCYLYINGGIYLDIKTELIKPLSSIFINKYIIYSCMSFLNDSIYQGIIATPPMNPFFLKLINTIIENKNPPEYHYFTKDFYNKISIETNNVPKKGLNIGKNQTFYLLEEKCSNNKENCYDGLDRYGHCCFGYINNEAVIKIRRSSYPW